jgi:CubicO group peptidase (beta-lactamase class C family)
MAHAQQTDRFEQRLAPFVAQFVSLTRVPGLAIGVVTQGELAYAAGFGVASLDDRRPVTPRTLFHMASVTKPFVATAVMQLVEEGRVALDAPVVAYVPYFTLRAGRAGELTVRQLLSHTSGMPDVEDYGWDRPEYDDGALERYVRSLSNEALLGEPGAAYAYSNMAYEVLGDLVAKVSGQSFEARAHERILTPLGMTDSTLLVREADPALLSRGHVIDAHGELQVSAIFPYTRAHAPSSTLYSNVLDMARWARALLRGGELDGARVLEQATLEAMWQPLAVVDAERQQRVGLAWRIGAFRGRRTLSHSGGDTGFQSHLVLVPEAGVAAVAMCNTDYVWDAPWHMTSAALEAALGMAG